MQQPKRTIYILYLLSTVIIVGIIGYYFLLDISLMDAFYMTVITISTVGFQEVTPLTVPAQLFTIILIFFSLGILGYAGSQSIGFFFEGTLREAWRKQKMNDQLSELNDHIIVCGAGETGQHIIQSLQKKQRPFCCHRI
ncbi:MAG: ion channel [Alkalibacterium sp.]